MTDLSETTVRLIRTLITEGRRDRLAVDALVALAAGDDLDAAIARLERLRDAIPDRRDGRRQENAQWNAIVERLPSLLETTIADLRAVAARSSAS